MESAFTTSPPRCCASATARSDFPVAVGPTTAITGWSATPRPERHEVTDAVRGVVVEQLCVPGLCRENRRDGVPGGRSADEQVSTAGRGALEASRVAGFQCSGDRLVEAHSPVVEV